MHLEQKIKFPFYDAHLSILCSTQLLCKIQFYKWF